MLQAIRNRPQEWLRGVFAAIDQMPMGSEERLRLQHYTVFILVGLPTMTVYGLFNLLVGSYLLVGLIAMSAVGLTTGWVLLRSSILGRSVYRTNIVLFGALILYMLVVGGDGGSKILWMYTFPPIAFFLLGKSEGLAWAAGHIVLTIAIWWLPPHFVTVYPYPSGFVVRFLTTYGIIAAVTYWFEHFRSTYRIGMEAERRRLVALINAIPDIVYFKDSSGRHLMVNKAFEDFTGLDRNAVIGRCDAEIFPDDLAASNEAADTEVFKSIQAVRVEHDGRDKEGRTVVLDTIRAPLVNAEGQATGIVGVSRDISDIRNAEAALHISQGLFEEIMTHSRDILYRRDLRTGRYDYISEAFCRLLGYSREETDAFSFNGMQELIHPEFRKSHSRFIASLLDAPRGDETDHIIEYPMQDRSGAYRWFSDRQTVVLGEDQKPVYLLGSNREITAQKEAEMAVREAHRQLLTILDSMDAHVYVADLETYEIRFMNRNMKQAFGDDLEGQFCWQAFRGEGGPCAHCTNGKLFDEAGHPAGVCEWEGRNPITRKWYMNYDRAIRWVDNRWVRLQIAIDITRIKELEEQRRRDETILQRAVKLEAVGTLAAGLAHDFNNLLSVIVGHVSLVEWEVGRNSDVASHLNAVASAAAKARDLANRLLTFSDGGVPARLELPIAPLLETAVAQVCEDSPLSCNMTIAEDLWSAAIDENQIQLAVKILLENAIDASPENAVVDIGGENVSAGAPGAPDIDPLPPGRYVRITVIDRGRGIPAEDLERIFDPYFSTKGLGSRKGTGLSLAITHSIIIRHDGLIFVDSASGRGTTVRLYLPASETVDSGATKPDVAGTPTARRRTGRVLVMDDEPSVQSLLKMMLKRMGYHPELTQNGQEAVVRYRDSLEAEEPFDAVILDLSIKEGMGGKEAMDRLLGLDPQVTAIVSSGYSESPILNEFSRHGFAGVLPKPYSYQKLKNLMTSVLNTERTPQAATYP